LDFALAIFFLFLYYVRPHEWLEWVAPLQPISGVLALGLAVIFFQIARRVDWHPLRFAREVLRTPIDWILLAFTLWVLYASGAPRDTFSEFYPVLAYYVLVQHALTTLRRMEGFLWVWLGLLLFISIMGVLSTFDIDPFGSQSYTLGMYKGRLSLNLSIFNNPNALAHSVVLILPMIYFLGIWHRNLLAQEVSPLLFAMPAWCLFLTQSKGGFLSGAAGVACSQIVGRPRWVQVALITVIYIGGLSVLMFLPRMQQLESIRGDRGVQGRLLVWNFGWTSLQTLPKGLGYSHFTQFVPVYVEGKYRLRKPAHSSYVEVGAELGKKGLFLWLGMLYYSLKSLVLIKSKNDQEERIRRLLFCLVIIYVTSSWMTNISYRGTFFIQLGTVAAFYRLMQRTPQPALAIEGVSSAPDLDVESGHAASVAGSLPLGAMPVAVVTLEPVEVIQAEASRPTLGASSRWLSWRRIAWLLLDAALIYLTYWVVLRAWHYFMVEWTGV
jgi:hypothetical protein